MHYEKKASRQQCDALGSILQGPAIHVEVTLTIFYSLLFMSVLAPEKFHELGS